MKNLIKISMIVAVTSSLLQAQDMKRYEVKSAKIEYELKGSGNMMGGMVKVKSVGKKSLIFDNYGLKELTEEKKVTKNTTMGQTQVDKVHLLNYMNGAILYGVDFKQKRISRMENPMASLGVLFGGESATKTGEEMLKKMGGKKIGRDKVAGHSCDVWDLNGIKQCLYKGVPLKIESNIMGLKTVEVATKAEFDLELKEDDFKLPDYPIYGTKSSKALDKSKLEEMDKKANETAKQESKEAEKGIAAMSIGVEAAIKAGYDPKTGKDMTPEQEKVMKKAMMDAMGGEQAILEKEKKEILKEFKDIPKAKECFSKANSVKEANTCERMLDGDDAEVHKEWNEKTKSKLLKDITAFENSKLCIEKADSFNALEACFPKN